MKKTSVSIMYDDENLNAIRLYMSQRDLDFKEELQKPYRACCPCKRKRISNKRQINWRNRICQFLIS